MIRVSVDVLPPATETIGALSFVPRLPPLAARWVWALWLLVVLWSTIEPTRIHVDYFGKLGGRVPSALIVFLAAGIAGAWLYSSLRLRRDFWRFEPALGLAAAVLACLLYEPVALVVVLVWMWTAFAAGRAILTRFGLAPGLGFGDAGLSLATGSGWLGIGFYLLGTAHLFLWPSLAGFLAVTLLIARKQLGAPVEVLHHMHRAWGAEGSLRDRAIGLSVFYGYLFLGFGLAVVLTPAINIDGIREHLRFGQIAVEAGWFQPSIFQRPSYYPQGFEVFLGAAWAFAGQAAAEMVNPFFFLGMLAVGFGIVRRAGVSRSSAVLGLLVVATVPFLHRTGVIVKNDPLLFLFQLSSLLAWMRARDEKDDRWLWAATVFLALSLGVKHTSIFGAIPLGLMLLWSTWRRPKLLAGLMAVGVVVGGLWFLRAYRETGNPVYPLGARVASTQWQSKGVFERPPLWQVYALYPWSVHYAGNSTYGSPSDNPVGMAIPLFLVGWLLVRRRKPNRNEFAVLLFCGIYYIYWGYIWGIVRYFMGPLLLLIVLTVARARGYWDSAGIWPRRFGLGALTWSFVFAVPPTMMFEINAPQLQYLSGRIDREEFLTKAVSGYRALRQISRRRMPGDEAMAFELQQLLYAPDQLRTSLVRRGPYTRALREHLVASRRYAHFVVAPEIDEEFPEYPGASDYERVYGDEAFAVWERKQGVQSREPITRLEQIGDIVQGKRPLPD